MTNGETTSRNRGKFGDRNVLIQRRKEPVDRLRGDLYDLFEDFFNDFSLTNFFSPRRMTNTTERLITTNFDLIEQDKKYLVKMELPGVKEKDINISVNKGVLTITGEKKEEQEEKDEQYYRRECTYGAFQQSISLPDNIKEDEIKANYKGGVLTVNIPKDEKKESTIKKIELQKSE